MCKQRLGLWMLILVVISGLLMVGSCVKKEDSGSSGSQPAESKVSNENMAPLPIELPAKQFVGTPVNLDGIEHLEPISDVARAPFPAPVGVTNVALNKPVTSSSDEPIIGDFPMITDGDKEAGEDSLVELDIMKQQVTIDLEAEHELFAIVVWHYHKQQRVYYDVVVQVSNDPDFIEGVTTLFNNDIDNSAGLGQGEDMHYIESNEGKLIDAKGVKGQYVRLWSGGSNVSEVNHYIEVEVYGRPAQ